MGQIVNLRPIVNRPGAFVENPSAKRHYPIVVAFHVRRLPNYDLIDHPVFLTWRLAGSLPRSRAFSPGIPSGRAFLAMDRLLDNAGTGPLHLSQPW